MDNFSKYIALDTHKDTNAVAIAAAGRSKAVYYGEIANTPEAIQGSLRHTVLPVHRRSCTSLCSRHTVLPVHKQLLHIPVPATYNPSLDIKTPVIVITPDFLYPQTDVQAQTPQPIFHPAPARHT